MRETWMDQSLLAAAKEIMSFLGIDMEVILEENYLDLDSIFY